MIITAQDALTPAPFRRRYILTVRHTKRDYEEALDYLSRCRGNYLRASRDVVSDSYEIQWRKAIYHEAQDRAELARRRYNMALDVRRIRRQSRQSKALIRLEPAS